MRLRLSVSAAMLIIVVAALTLPASASRSPHLEDQTGRIFTLASLRGTPLVVTFVSAHCQDACPLINAQFAQAAQTIQARHLHVRLLTITLDPERDSPTLMRALAKTFDANPRYWIVAGGQVGDVHAVMRRFGVVAQRGRSGYADVHSTFVYFVDRTGRLRKTILASTDLGRQLVATLESNRKALAQ